VGCLTPSFSGLILIFTCSASKKSAGCYHPALSALTLPQVIA
jgi:hypothetical protein